MIEIYTDGACRGNPGPGGWGAVIVRDGQPETELSGHSPRTTNNRMEIQAVIEGLGAVPPGEPVCVVSDSEYVIKTQTRGWQKKANQDLWAELDRATQGRRIEWRWTQGHSGDPFNELADRLAVAASMPPNGGSDVQPEGAPRLSHITETGEARMVDVGDKEITERVAVARATLVMKPETIKLIQSGGFEKGDVLGVARVAGVMAAKQTHGLIPLCHPIPLAQVTIDFDTTSREGELQLTAMARATWKTGVEMEALTAVTVSALTVYDMCKAVDRGMLIKDVRLVKKTGGKSGDWSAE